MINRLVDWFKDKMCPDSDKDVRGKWDAPYWYDEQNELYWGRIYIKWEEDGVSVALWPKEVELYDAKGAFRDPRVHIFIGGSLAEVMTGISDYHGASIGHYECDMHYEDVEAWFRDVMGKGWLHEDTMALIDLEKCKVSMGGFGYDYDGFVEMLSRFDRDWEVLYGKNA